ncbi:MULTISPECIES: response regulator [unclassified Paenibacillus]|uniref:response regulator transcription factor n=1 Tax=unclassified Paenibacillus TaxID=185978 RepID=UPI0024054DEA|nr:MULTISPECIES: response regulator [unclassified Paenibacillus]MDF9845331.1 two-component system response regulator YesN [Paenibacillus sp. PastF-2]MDF9851913.1 two-component system response regulator YesN [Paenibacillus sp. PastM-2]MDF9858473.1 two-component system response regulator YesN [Paenibacillus sp. PastF-1]MDH6483743.1 two-component system response regulator YesN [Paenibacillus sp. PastH-2]MDH6511122.1 two-component system response regulator YesN [Paenibacillus sp. PastM-3]
MKALIVDDEARVRKAVRLLVDWDAHQIGEIMEAGSGNEAIELIRKHKPGLVIMDMMMESGNGIELMTWVNEFAGSTKFIVVSGHNDFDFVRETVRHGGIDYILKPIEPEAINTAVAKAVAAWRSEAEERSQRQRQSIRLNEIKPIYGERLLSALIDDPVTAETTLRRLVAEGVIPGSAGSARLLLVQTDAGNNPLLRRFGGDSELLYYAIVNICNEFLQPQGTGTAFRYWGGPPEIAILLWDVQESVTELISRINQGLFHTLQLRMHFGISSAGSLPGQLAAQRTEAAEALLRRNLLRHEDYSHFSVASAEYRQDTGAAGARPIFADVQEDWKMAIVSGNTDALSAAAQHWTEELGRSGVVTPEMLGSWKADALLFRSRLVRETLGSQAESALAELELGDRDNPAPYAGGYSFSLFAWRDWSYALMTSLSRVLSAAQVKERNPLTEIVKYIDQNYMADLSLQEVAGKFYVSREYISRRFKQEYGINFSDYIVSVRIEKAKLLLQNPNLKLSQISEMVGFHDVKYFSKVFKKQTGATPKDYRIQVTL